MAKKIDKKRNRTNIVEVELEQHIMNGLKNAENILIDFEDITLNPILNHKNKINTKLTEFAGSCKVYSESFRKSFGGIVLTLRRLEKAELINRTDYSDEPVDINLENHIKGKLNLLLENDTKILQAFAEINRDVGRYTIPVRDLAARAFRVFGRVANQLQFILNDLEKVERIELAEFKKGKLMGKLK